jgi:hypothetical protein
MRKTTIVLLSAAFVATLPSIASAKRMKHHRHHHRHVAMQPVSDDNAGPRFFGAALHQLIVPLEVTFGPRAY